MPASAAVPALLLCTAATILLVFVCISAPTWDKISFLNVGTGTQQIRHGILGYTGSKTNIGYLFPAGGSTVNTKVIHNLTKVLILHPIAAGLAGLSVLFGICGASYHRAGTILMTLFSSLATLVTLVAFVIDMVLFGIVRNRLRKEGITAAYGNANWLTLGALVALLVGFCVGSCGVFGSYRRKREAY